MRRPEQGPQGDAARVHQPVGGGVEAGVDRIGEAQQDDLVAVLLDGRETSTPAYGMPSRTSWTSGRRGSRPRDKPPCGPQVHGIPSTPYAIRSPKAMWPDPPGRTASPRITASRVPVSSIRTRVAAGSPCDLYCGGADLDQYAAEQFRGEVGEQRAAGTDGQDDRSERPTCCEREQTRREARPERSAEGQPQVRCLLGARAAAAAGRPRRRTASSSWPRRPEMQRSGRTRWARGL